MIIHLTLYGLLREKLPKQARGKTDLEVKAGTSLQDVINSLGITSHVTCAVNGTVERDMNTILQPGDQVNIFRPAGGG